MIPEPQRTYLLELLNALGPAAEDFIVAGAQAIKFTVAQARATKDVDFLLNVLALRKAPLQLAQVLETLGYTPVPESRNFQFEKEIPGSTEKMRIEFMAPEEYKREKDPSSELLRRSLATRPHFPMTRRNGRSTMKWPESLTDEW